MAQGLFLRGIGEPAGMSGAGEESAARLMEVDLAGPKVSAASFAAGDRVMPRDRR